MDEDTPQVIKDAQAVLDAINKANEEGKRILTEQKELAARHMMGGKSQAGQQDPPKPAMSDREYADLAIRGKLPLE